jgi:transcriptional regulator of arginine metabolism
MEKTMMSKKSRHAKILDSLRKNPVSSQEELSNLLAKDGVHVTQPTLSRDIRELGLIKVRGVYQIPEEHLSAPPLETVRKSLQQLVTRSGLSGNIVMVKTSPGYGHSLGVVLDSAQWPEVLGTVAGDDTVFVLLRHPRFGRKVLRRIQEYSA